MKTSTSSRRKPSSLGALDVIVADDEPGDNLLFTLAAKDAACELKLTFVADGEELLRLLADRLAAGDPPDVVVLDIRMPRCSGLEAMEVIASSEELRRIPVVMFTTSRREADISRGLELGVVRFETKPSSYPELVEFLGELPDAARSREARAGACIPGSRSDET